MLATSVDPDQTPHFAASELDLHDVCVRPQNGFQDLEWLNFPFLGLGLQFWTTNYCLNLIT